MVLWIEQMRDAENGPESKDGDHLSRLRNTTVRDCES